MTLGGADGHEPADSRTFFSPFSTRFSSMFKPPQRLSPRSGRTPRGPRGWGHGQPRGVHQERGGKRPWGTRVQNAKRIFSTVRRSRKRRRKNRHAGHETSHG